MTPHDLPTSIEELQRLLSQTRCEKENLRREVDDAKREAFIAKQQTIELTSTVEAQKKRLEQSERTIKELLQELPLLHLMFFT